ncbi:unnamed protein product [Polarella glacialis]|uniref:Ion transport domain-containing protein n=1 Tax=Polarella glacialis TaxID=89957 RepID=A0A813JRW4_POLGL|nr:unnamed protein product [Polarella glacialis]CAE8681958.1 unnamed protein product [Polarella glacialis]
MKVADAMFCQMKGSVSGSTTLSAFSGMNADEQEDDADAKDTITQRMDALRFAFDEEMTSFTDYAAYMAENIVAAHANALFYLLLVAAAFVICVLALGWFAFTTDAAGDEPEEPLSYAHSLFITFQVVASLGMDPKITDPGHIVLFVLMCFSGLFLFAILIGMITESFKSFVDHMDEGKSKVPLSNHTLILGWNETTVRVVCQMALLRRQLRQQNETWVRTLFPWTRVKPSTPVAQAPVVILTNRFSKAEMQEALELAFDEIGISTKRTMVGRDIICRIGDPTSIKDLQRVGAHRARSILVMMTDADKEGDAEGYVEHGMTLRTLLAIRIVMNTAKKVPYKDDMRVVAQMEKSSDYMDCIQLGKSSDGRNILNIVDLNLFLNSVTFAGVSHPGIAFALLEMLSFEGVAMRLRKVTDFPDGGKHIIGLTARDASLVWENAVFLDVIEDPSVAKSMASPGGLASPGDRIITSTDRVVFLSKVLVCGWCPDWDAPSSFAQCIRRTASELPKGSQMTFLNMKNLSDEDDGDEGVFSKLMQQVCKTDPNISEEEIANPGKGGTWAYKDEVTITYEFGDAGSYSSLKRAMEKQVFHKAIVLSTAVKLNRHAFVRDTRVLTILVCLRALQRKLHNQPLHVIAENSMDNTSMLAIAPTAEHDGIPDFVNTHAIYACALAQSLAYPRMVPFISSLFSREDGTPNIFLIDAMELHEGEWTFGSIVALVKKSLPDDVVIGLRQSSGKVLMAPKLSEVCHCHAGDRLMIISRRARHADESSEASED